MSSKQKRIQARRNGAKAAGAKSPEGIKRSSANALKHGLQAKAHVLSNESQAEYDYLRQQYVNRFRPQDSVELDLVDDMVGARWRLRRIAMLQTARFELHMSRCDKHTDRSYSLGDEPARMAVAFGYASNTDKSLELLVRYETTYSRMYDRAMKALEKLQANRPIDEESAECEELRNDPIGASEPPPDVQPHPISIVVNEPKSAELPPNGPGVQVDPKEHCQN